MIWLPGAGLVFFSVYIFTTVLYKQIAWARTEGQISGVVIESDHVGKDYVYEKAIFTDATGQQIEIVSKYSAGSTEANLKREGSVTIYYNPENSADADIFSWGHYLPVLFLPFGMLLLYLGWPSRDV
ncbi:MAG TPA: DUF3592 domain-containing protein [Chryseosolibacter sp.]|nr:DUF3592 domain-containing protein [Chryseosolibacter sp.]